MVVIPATYAISAFSSHLTSTGEMIPCLIASICSLSLAHGLRSFPPVINAVFNADYLCRLVVFMSREKSSHGRGRVSWRLSHGWLEFQDEHGQAWG